MHNRSVALIFPGQGAQIPGMGFDFFTNYPAARELFVQADRFLGYSFSSLIFEGSKEELSMTKHSQLAIFIVSVAMCRVMEEKYPNIPVRAVAGLSLGEYTALWAGGFLSFEELLPIVKARGEYMQAACEENAGCMYVVLGLTESQIEQVLVEQAQEDRRKTLYVANLNCPGQIVISGEKEGSERVCTLLKQAGAKGVIPLDVAGAFHSPLMISAQQRLAPLISKLSFSKKRQSRAFVANVIGDFVEDEEEIKKLLISQVTAPVYWQKGIEAMIHFGITDFIEIGPGKTLSAMNKRISVSAKTATVSTVEQLEELKECYGPLS